MREAEWEGASQRGKEGGKMGRLEVKIENWRQCRKRRFELK